MNFTEQIAEWRNLPTTLGQCRKVGRECADEAVANPMRAWSTGECISADRVEYWADELTALIGDGAREQQP